jgi:hypothetical protein
MIHIGDSLPTLQTYFAVQEFRFMNKLDLSMKLSLLQVRSSANISGV